MFHRIVFFTVGVFAVLGYSSSADEEQSVTHQKELLVETMAKRLGILEEKYESKFQTMEQENLLSKSELVSLKSEVALLRFPNDGGASSNGNETTDNVHGPKLATRGSRRALRVSTQDLHNQIAFQAVLDHNIGNIGADETIKFNKPQINLGGGYNPSTGIFTCSRPGLYVFHITIVLHSAKSGEFHLLKNGHEFGRVYSGDEDSGRADGAASTAIVQLEVSDTVWVASNTNHDSGEVLLPSYCFLAGYLLFPNTV
ncbi:collagen alpha-2(VIII) chain-like [Pecten maximus]|uniref:collagen alpha-2(VIII) chain-like n=1 Tax=Pecten maximus TaxID=6579 RepID=UPI0014587F08|nr:collagen alpha-2(VIII) chain-like [Pecten maximus]